MNFPIERVRAEFPSLAITDQGRRRVYLDNPAGTQVPRRVADAVASCLINTNANLGGYFASSEAAGAVVAEAHAAAATLLGAASPSEIVFGQSMTSLTFQISRSIGRQLRPGDEIIVTRMDHDANVAPWLMMAEERQVTVRWLSFDPDSWRIEPEALAALLTDRTRLLALCYASNLTGSVNDVAALTAQARAAGALVFIDAVQFAPHGLVDVQALGCDFLACSAYKIFGPHMGILWGRADLLTELPAYKVRPSSNKIPNRFEPGTPQIELQAGLTAAVDYIGWLGDAAGSLRERVVAGWRAATEWEAALALRLIESLQAVPGITIRGITNPNRIGFRVPTVSFTHATAAPDTVAEALAKDGIFIWSGHNYAVELVRQLDIDEETGVVRIGMAHYNTLDEVDQAVAAVARTVR